MRHFVIQADDKCILEELLKTKAIQENQKLPAVKKVTIFGASRKFFGPSCFLTSLITFSSCKVQEKSTSFKRLRESNQIVPLVRKPKFKFKSLFTLVKNSEIFFKKVIEV